MNLKGFFRPGRMLANSKSAYIAKHPNNFVVFNAFLCTVNGKIWHGDLDLTLDKKILVQLASESELPIYVFRETDMYTSFENDEALPPIDKAVAVISAEGLTHVF